MPERTTLPGPYVLEGALDLATSRLEPMIEHAAAVVARARASQELTRARAEVTGELRYYVDELDQRLAALAQLFAGAGATPTAGPHDDDDDDGHDYDDYDDESPHVPRKHASARGRAVARPPAARDSLLAGIAEAMLIERALPTLTDPDAHAATVVISRIGNVNGDGVVAVTQVYAYIGSPWFDAGASATESGEVTTFSNGRGSGTFADWQSYWRKRRDVAVTLRGLFVRQALETDHGTWMLSAAAAEPDVVRVEVRSGAARPPADVLREHITARQAVEHALEHGGALPPNPDALLPVTRTVTARAPLFFWATPFDIDVEDFSTGWADRTKVKDIATAVRRCWHLAWSRRS
jgi:hypothetical protein